MLLLLLAQLMTALSVGNLAAELSASGLARFKQLGGISILSSFYLPLFRVRIVVAAIFLFQLAPTAKLRFRFRDYLVLTRRPLLLLVAQQKSKNEYI